MAFSFFSNPKVGFGFMVGALVSFVVGGWYCESNNSVSIKIGLGLVASGIVMLSIAAYIAYRIDDDPREQPQQINSLSNQ